MGYIKIPAYLLSSVC